MNDPHTPHTPRSEKKKVKTPKFVVVPPRTAHPLPALEEPFSSNAKCDCSSSCPDEFRFTSHGYSNSKLGSSLVADGTADLNSVCPFLISNFEKIHSQHAVIVSMLQRVGDLCRVPIPSLASPKVVSITNEVDMKAAPPGKKHSVDVRSSTSMDPRPIMADRVSLQPEIETNFPSQTVDADDSSSSPRSGKQNNADFEIRYSGVSDNRLSSGRGRFLIENFELMEKLSRIVQKHSKVLQRKRTSIAHLVWQFLENPTSSMSAYIYGSYFSPFVLLASVLVSFMQTVEDTSLPDNIFTVIQVTFEFWFAAEIAIRFMVSPDKANFWVSFFNFVDCISAIPFFLRIAISLIDSDRDIIGLVDGVVPMLRLMKILRRFHKFQLLVSAFGMALEALPVLLFTLSLIAILFFGVIYVIESRTLVESLPKSLWFVIVTMTTVGYGDTVPESLGGKAASVILMVTSALYMAMPIGIVGSAFSEVWNDRDRLLLIAILRESFAISGISKQLIREIFDQLLEEEGGTPTEDPEIGILAFQKMLACLQVDVSEDRVVKLFNALDVDGGGTISCDEFIHTLFPNAFLKLMPRDTCAAQRSESSSASA